MSAVFRAIRNSTLISGPIIFDASPTIPPLPRTDIITEFGHSRLYRKPSRMPSGILPPWRDPQIRHGRQSDEKISPLPPGVPENLYGGMANGPPPGLVRVTQPVPVNNYLEWRRESKSKPIILNDDHVALFGDIAEFLQTGFNIHGNRIILNLTCQICGDHYLEVPACVSPLRKPESPIEPMVILPCGHFFGGRCIDRWFQTRRETNLASECPLCRFPCVHQECGHDIRIRHYDALFERNGQCPFTIPEGGAIPAYCASCREEWLRAVTLRVVETVYPVDIPTSAFVDPQAMDAGDIKELRTRMWDDIIRAAHSVEKWYHHW
ncbi:hypothetical protein GGR54DRAFT_155070 [Hypoxylon sp. NC1633]|nr:hypothetical protein GGR54DRAFT_155070 [Hypoxylon sp. NC1633]